ncbi:glycosyltransferase [Glutamicibacter sp. PS]|uniref:glycosyltransferase n=1 Tax=Glutamicibacter sp. PS TaxID=3075634 RepID=UPI00284E40E8|nr:glycosyltransferase [Glutamicibacter sp. PS]MDR4532841.1 glycosyltransferase [Glutamicibacter sp. PS]
MRIAMLSLHTSPVSQPGTGDAGGMNVYVLQLAMALAGMGHEVHMVTRGAGTAQVQDVAANLWHHEVPVRPGQQLSKEQLADVLEEASEAIATHFDGWFASGQGFDVLHAHYWLSGRVAESLHSHWGTPFALTLHTSAAVKMHESNLPETPERLEAERQLLARADAVIANTPVEADQLVRYYAVDEAKLSVITPGVDHVRFNPAAQAEHIRAPEGSDLHVVYAGRMQKLKGPHILLQALAKARQKRPDLRLTAQLIGANSGADAYDVPGMVQQLDLEDVVELCAPCPPEVLAAYFAAADIVAVPSLSETFGLVAAEAQACGTPVLANRVGGLSHAVIDRHTGWLIEAEERVKSWATALIRLAENPQAIERASEAAIAHARSLTWTAAAEHTLNCYQQLLCPTAGRCQ